MGIERLLVYKGRHGRVVEGAGCRERGSEANRERRRFLCVRGGRMRGRDSVSVVRVTSRDESSKAYSISRESHDHLVTDAFVENNRRVRHRSISSSRFES
jgi:hypothetical protein